MQDGQHFGYSTLSNQGFCHLCSTETQPKKFEINKMQKINIFGKWKNASHSISQYKKSLLID